MAADAASDASEACIGLLEDVKTPETVIMDEPPPATQEEPPPAEEEPPPATQLEDPPLNFINYGSWIGFYF